MRLHCTVGLVAEFFSQSIKGFAVCLKDLGVGEISLFDRSYRKVHKLAPTTVRTHAILMELLAKFGLVLLRHMGLLLKFFLTVGKGAVLSVLAYAVGLPIFADLPQKLLNF